jgi:hypothetical protein
MTILLEGKDLIDLAEHSIPLSLAEFRDIIESRGHQIVLSYTNVRELAAPMVTTGDILKIHRLLHAIETLPVRYIREGFISDNEMREAAGAFEAGKEYPPIDPFVRRWDYTFHEGESPAYQYIGYSIFEIIYSIYRKQPGFLLRESLLATAFSGNLVPQDPNDEPASELLERIKAQRLKQVPSKATARSSKLARRTSIAAEAT